MANPKKRVPENVPGDFFVDSTCIDCDACRQIAPSVFGEAAQTSFVKAQPISGADRRRASQALLSCPTGSIGCLGDDDPKAVIKDFPLVIEEPVYYCGFNSPKSYGGNSYFVKHAAGNWLIDSPKFITPLVQQLESQGGISHIFLTHRDDVADARRYAEHFGGRRIIHQEELSSQPGAEVVLQGAGPWELAPGLLAIPTPGHTLGHCVLLFQERFLFTGGPPGLGPRRTAALGLRGLLLVLVGAADRVDETAGGVSLRVGPTRPRSERAIARRRNAAPDREPGRVDVTDQVHHEKLPRFSLWSRSGTYRVS
jgi:ferredoxin